MIVLQRAAGATPIPLFRRHSNMARKDFHTVEDWAYLAKQAKYDPELLARLLNVCPRQLRRYTRELFNNSPQEWLDERRLADASILLQGNDLVKTIAYDLGFKTVAHFSKKFKIRYGISPKAYKRYLETGRIS
jgi:AraC-like DNA-binding protein